METTLSSQIEDRINYISKPLIIERKPVVVFWKTAGPSYLSFTAAWADETNSIETLLYRIIEVCKTWKEANQIAQNMQEGRDKARANEHP